MLYPHNGILYSNESECATATCSYMDESHKFEWKKPGAKEDMSNDSIYIKVQKQAKLSCGVINLNLWLPFGGL